MATVAIIVSVQVLTFGVLLKLLLTTLGIVVYKIIVPLCLAVVLARTITAILSVAFAIKQWTVVSNQRTVRGAAGGLRPNFIWLIG